MKRCCVRHLPTLQIKRIELVLMSRLVCPEDWDFTLHSGCRHHRVAPMSTPY